jgi:ubiquinone/menaquinone biosynthesis C-methylase UbiE
MEQQLEQIREQQKASWNKSSAGWKKWDYINQDFIKPMGDEIIRLLHPEEGDIVLDVAAGTGEPGLTIAARVGSGKVVITDLSDGMLEVARENAVRRGIRNIEIRACDVCELPFADNSFDLVSCRFGFMFFPDMELAVKEMVRVLKPGGKLATSVWNVPEKNFWVTAIMGTINKNLPLPVPPPGAPGMFRCAKDGLISGLFAQGGLKNITQKEITSKFKCRTAAGYWEMMTEVAAPVIAALSKTDDEMRKRIKTETAQVLTERHPEEDIMIDASALVIYGEK